MKTTKTNVSMSDDINYILFQDEAIIGDYQVIGRTLFLKGQQQIFPTYAKHQRVKLIQPYLEKYSYYLELVFLPPYSPNLNRIDKFWKWLKQLCIYNVFYSSVAEIRNRVQEFIKQVNQNPLNTVG